MECVIKNRKNVYIRLNSNGCPVTCSESEKTIFDEHKAKNIIGSLPKNLKKLKFKVEYVCEDVKKDEEKFIHKDYILPEEIKVWVEKFGICDDIIKEAQKRNDELNKIMSNYDKTISNLLHEIELENSKNAYEGYLKYRELKTVVDERRKSKDEWLIINNILRMDFRNLDREAVNKAVIGLAKRKFTYRIVEEVNGDEVL